MQIDIKVEVPRVSDDVREIEEWVHGKLSQWVCGTLRPLTGQPGPVLSAMQATKPWVTQRGVIPEEEALVDFVNLNPEDVHKIAGFIRKYGLFSDGDRDTKASHPEKVKEYCQKSAQSRLTPFATDVASVRDTQKRVAAMLKLARARGKGEREIAFGEFMKVNPDLGKAVRRRHPQDFEKRLLSYYVTQGLALVPLGLEEQHKKMVAVAMTADVRSALYVALLSHIVSGTELKSCARPGCNKLFVVTRKNKKFHSLECQNLASIGIAHGRDAGANNGALAMSQLRRPGIAYFGCKNGMILVPTIYWGQENENRVGFLPPRRRFGWFGGSWSLFDQPCTIISRRPKRPWPPTTPQVLPHTAYRRGALRR
jgi:hypothetical protein